jgi:hypothetical protein
MSKKKKTSDSYEVGYGKPPKSTQFQKGISGNPRGRPKKSLNFDDELIRESNSLMTINENGRRKRISKYGVVVKQLMKQAMTGIPQAHRTYFYLLRQALEGVSQTGPQPNYSGKVDNSRYLTDEELMRIIAADMKKRKK